MSGSGGIAPLQLSTRRGGLASFTSQHHIIARPPGCIESRSGRFGEEKGPLPLLEIEP
jgi:hypothetical protein